MFNDANMIIGCPVLDKAEANALHYRLEHSEVNGIVFCEQLKYFDFEKKELFVFFLRGYQGLHGGLGYHSGDF
ncbi:MAG: hypothetical protein IJH82_09705 [Lachnospiraceae bacterium]|nr:hypothetical protein [Lachnospiraceae bacterium]